MTTKTRISLRHIDIDKSNAVIVIAIAGAAACLVFSIVSVRALWNQASYNKRVIKAKETTVQQVKTNVASLDSLKDSYRVFISAPTNVIGGSATGGGDRDGDNAKITLDAMPSIYDFPGTISGLNKVLTGRRVSEVEITGVDEEATKLTNQQPGVSPIALSIAAVGNTEDTQDLLSTLDLSIRPMNVKKVSFSGEGSGLLNILVDLDTYYQPKKKFEVKTEVIK